MFDEQYAARLIPTSGIKGADEQERRVVSALLAAMSAVKEFGRALTAPLGAPAGHMSTFIEVPFDLNGDSKRPDGVIVISRGKQSWRCLVEVKTSTNCLVGDQLEAYLDIARAEGFDCVLTISNELPAVPGQHPTAVDNRKTKRVALKHLSWTEIHSKAIMQEAHHGVSDPDQAWILSEFIRYLEHPNAGAMEFRDMGPAWVGVRDRVALGTLRAGDKDVDAVAQRWDQLLRFECLRLGRRIGLQVEPLMTKKDLVDPVPHRKWLAQQLVEHGQLIGGLTIPGTVGAITLTADLRASRLFCSVEVGAPKEGKARTRLNWLLRQLKTAPPGLCVDAYAFYERGDGTSADLQDVIKDPDAFIGNPKRDLRGFRLTMSRSMAARKAQSRDGFVETASRFLDDFYGEVVQQLRPWTHVPPKLREEPAAKPTPQQQLVSTSYSSQDFHSGAGEDPADEARLPIGVGGEFPQEE